MKHAAVRATNREDAGQNLESNRNVRQHPSMFLDGDSQVRRLNRTTVLTSKPLSLIFFLPESFLRRTEVRTTSGTRCAGATPAPTSLPSSPSLRRARTPIIRTATVVLEGQNPDVIGEHAVVNRVRKAGQQVAPDITFYDAPSFRPCGNSRNRFVDCVQELRSEGGNLLS